MAKTWSVSEAVKAINAGDKEAIADIGKRFPQFAVAAAKVGDNEGAMTILGALPEHVTARKVEAILKDGVDEDTDAETTDDDEEVEEEKPKRGRKSATSDDDKKAKAKARREARKAKAKAETEDDEEEESEETEVDYSSMNAIDLYKLCKKRKLDVEPKKKAAYYIDALKADDSDVEESEEDDWEDEEEEEKPAKKSKGRPAKAEKAKKEDEDEDWDI